jgi:hypothetical protein
MGADLQTGEFLPALVDFDANLGVAMIYDADFDIDACFSADIIPRGWGSSASLAKPSDRAGCKECPYCGFSQF